MPTTKQRLNISLPSRVETAIKNLSVRDNMPQATKAAQLIELALEIEEDDIFNTIASKRDTKNVKFVSHKAAWS